MAITHVGAGPHGSAFNSTVLPLPPGVQSGDLLILHHYVQGSSTVGSPVPSGFTELGRVEGFDSGDNIIWSYKLAGPTETDLNLGNSGVNAGGFLDVYRGVDTTTPVSGAVVESAGSGITGKTPLTNTSFTTTASNAFVYVGVAVNVDGTNGLSLATPPDQGFAAAASGSPFSTAQGSDWSNASAYKHLSSPVAQTLPAWDATENAKWAFLALEIHPLVVVTPSAQIHELQNGSGFEVLSVEIRNDTGFEVVSTEVHDGIQFI